MGISKAILIAISGLNAGCSVFGIRSEETPAYVVLESDGPKEIREYTEHIVAKTKVQGSFKDAQNAGFRILAKYIFGENETQQKISMTAPVTQAPASEKIAMTAPVTQTKDGDDWIMTFVMPAKYTLASLPKPKDPRVQFEVIPPKRIAVLRYSGSWSEEKQAERGKELTAWIRQQGKWSADGAARFAGYDPPWTLPFLRRNEILIDVTAP